MNAYIYECRSTFPKKHIQDWSFSFGTQIKLPPILNYFQNFFHGPARLTNDGSPDTYSSTTLTKFGQISGGNKRLKNLVVGLQVTT